MKMNNSKILGASKSFDNSSSIKKKSQQNQSFIQEKMKPWSNPNGKESTPKLKSNPLKQKISEFGFIELNKIDDSIAKSMLKLEKSMNKSYIQKPFEQPISMPQENFQQSLEYQNIDKLINKHNTIIKNARSGNFTDLLISHDAFHNKYPYSSEVNQYKLQQQQTVKRETLTDDQVNEFSKKNLICNKQKMIMQILFGRHEPNMYIFKNDEIGQIIQQLTVNQDLHGLKIVYLQLMIDYGAFDCIHDAYKQYINSSINSKSKQVKAIQ
ncbi:Hypothetical_protein [Hexamita inflata]|uniref:Hypothetical_protein n=1 Tax=Hexamita inflata TaxID=28002 RepID=A0AA86UA69_9EUKA|nr:Hypothetical protein HINF_LOCUS32416 [Hexamita inflata]